LSALPALAANLDLQDLKVKKFNGVSALNFLMVTRYGA